MGNKPEYTKKQLDAINIRNRNTLVSAAAGSGKTAVLVQRIINRILDEDNPVDIDRILVMTFTRAAARQMKERILSAINEKKMTDPHNSNLARQSALVHNSYVMTIDGFCMTVVRNHFEEIGINPDFRMADEGEIRLLKQDVIETVLEEFYEKAEAEFIEMTEVFAAKKTDVTIEKLALSLYDYSQSYPNPLGWLEKCTDEYGKTEFVEQYILQVNKELSRTKALLSKALEYCYMQFGPSAYADAIENDIEIVDNLIDADDYETLYDKCRDFLEKGFSKLSRISIPKEGDASPEEIGQRIELKERVTSIRDYSKKLISAIVDTVTGSPMSEIKDGMDKMKRPVIELVSLVKAFAIEFDEQKRKKNIVDFNDIEHMCLTILSKGKETTAREYREFFKEIYVDEYQDSNFVQEEIVNLISNTSESGGNVFMVGDVKQSIYGFRNAKPELFVNKYDTYAKCPNDLSDEMPANIRIDLSDNFRSRYEVIDSVNSIFYKIMKKELGGIEYDDDSALHAGRTFSESECDYETELLLLKKDEDVPDKEAEALLVANRIKSLMNTLYVEGENGRRPLKYSDIVILLRTTKGFDTTFMEVLEGQGIPAFVTSSTGYFEAMEISTILNYLRIIDNPLQDIPLAAVMMSVIGGFFEEELAIIRGEFKDGYLYDALVKHREMHINENTSISKKVVSFLNELEYYRKKSQYTSVDELLTEIIDGDYGKIIKAMPGGAKKYANLNMLLKKAMEFGKTSYKGIFQFNRYIEAIRKYEIDYGEANLLDENDDTVRIMSIHKSKGLEFPVCFISGMSKKFNMMDIRDTVLTDSEYGIATDVVDIDRRLKSKSLYKHVVARKKKAEIIAEELRLLYVAMTRAKEKLIMTGTVKDEDTVRLSLVTIDNSNSYLDMYACACEGAAVQNIREEYTSVEELVDDKVKETVDSEIKRNQILSLINNNETIDSKAEDKTTETEVIHEIRRRLEYRYPFEDKGFVKVSVSELKHRSEDTDYDNTEEIDVTQKLYEKQVSTGKNMAALHGTAVHRIFEIWDYNRDTTEKSVKEFLLYVKEEKLMEDELLELVRVDEVLAFVTSELAVRMKTAFLNGGLRREQPFMICDDKDDPESMIVQGVIDAYFIEDGEIVVVDYKTDRGKSLQKMVEDHRTQLEYYGTALSRVLHKKIKESVIYSTFHGKAISI